MGYFILLQFAGSKKKKKKILQWLSYSEERSFQAL